MAVKRKKEKHAGMGQLENMKNRPMILIGNANPHMSEAGAMIPTVQFLGTPLSWISHLGQKGLPRTPPQFSGIFSSSHEHYRKYHSTASLHKQKRARKDRAIEGDEGLSGTNGITGSNLTDITSKFRPQRAANLSLRPIELSSSSRPSTNTTIIPSAPLSGDVAETSFPSLPERPKWVMDKHPERNRYSADPTPSTHATSAFSPIPSPSAPPSPDSFQSSTQSHSTTHLPHLTSSSAVHQVSISNKSFTRRVAVAIGSVRFSTPNVLPLVQKHALKKGDVLSVARVAGIMAVKRTADFIPLTHGGVAVEGCTVDLELVDPSESIVAAEPQNEWLTRVNMDKWMKEPLSPHGGIRIKVSVETTGKTGVEMEALVGVMGAALTVVDMCKAADKHLLVGDVRVVGKKGGKSGDWGIFVGDGESRPEEELSGTQTESTVRKSGLTEGGETRPQPLIRRTNDDRNILEILKWDQNAQSIISKSLEVPADDSRATEGQTKEQEEKPARDPSSDGNLLRRVMSKKKEGVQWKPVKVHNEEVEEETPEEETLERLSKELKEHARLFHDSNKESGTLRAPSPPFKEPWKVKLEAKKKKGKKGGKKK
ncbi:MAG: hypothetical protein Q9184_007854 [Pyrenodesmia sp. 2 TL-2023]